MTMNNYNEKEVILNNGVKMPILGFGVYQIPKEDTKQAVLEALKVGYRHIDTAQSYFNEAEVGEAISESGIPREEIFLTTKIWIDNYGYEKAKASIDESLRKLKLIMLIYSYCISHSVITMVPIVRLKMLIKPAKHVPSV